MAKLSILKAKGPDLWMVSIPPRMTDDGRRKKKYFSSEEDAGMEVERLAMLRRAHGVMARWIDDVPARQAYMREIVLWQQRRDSSSRLFKESGKTTGPWPR